MFFFKFKKIINSRKWIWLMVIMVIILTATIIRFYQLGNPSNGFYLDEAAIGYNAYSILKTGKDEFGKSFPILFRSFTDFKAPLYIYLSIIPIKIFGLTSFSTRFISALSGSIAILITFLFIKLIIKRASATIVFTKALHKNRLLKRFFI